MKKTRTFSYRKTLKRHELKTQKINLFYKEGQGIGPSRFLDLKFVENK